MAVTKIWAIKDSLQRVLDYAANPDKTEYDALAQTLHYAENDAKTKLNESAQLVTGIHCRANHAWEDMRAVQERFGKADGVVALHAYQSFREGEVTPEQCHEIGVALARKVWGRRFQVLVATHMNTDNLHNHFVINSVSYVDGKKYEQRRSQYAEFRAASDKLCREYGLSVVEQPKAKEPERYARMVNLNVPIPLAIVITIVVGCLLGAANGIIAVKMHIAPIIVTLGTMLVLQGVAYLITGGYPITGMPEAFKVIGQGYVGIIPVPVIIFVLFIIFGAILMNKTYLGRYIYALGGNKEAARLAGINVDKLTVAVYTFCGFCASIAALIMVGRTNAAQPGAGSSYSFDCMTAACLGGVSIAGGEGKISGTVIGVIILGILDNGLVLMSVNTNWQSVIKGLILLAAVAIDCYQVVNKNRKKAAA